LKVGVNLAIKELTQLELLKLSLEYSISKKHQQDLKRRIAEMEGGEVIKPVKKVKKRKVVQESFL